jgi:hypothetical protein
MNHIFNLKKIPEERAFISVLEYITKNPGAKLWEIVLLRILELNSGKSH